MAKQLIEENMVKIEQICSSSYSYKQKIEGMKNINTDYIQKYCIDKAEFVKFPKSGVIKKFSIVKRRIHRNELVDTALNNLIFHRDEENPTFLDLYDLCFQKNIIKENEYLGQYNKEDLHEFFI